MRALTSFAPDQAANIRFLLTDIDDLIDAGFLPLGFGSRPDGSGLIAIGDTIVDSGFHFR